jgi:cold shock CspA family protein
MARSQQTTAKKDRQKKKQKEQREKQERREERKAKKPKTFEEMLAYVDEKGNFSSTPPEPKSKVKAEDMQIGISRQEDMPPEDPMRKGTVNHFNESKGYGFITDSENGQSIFVHVSNLEEPLNEGDKVTFETERGPKGPVAVRVRKVR